MGIEALGMCSEGESGSYAAEGRLQLGHPRPVNVHGGMLCTVTPAGSIFLDAVRQLRGEAGPRQIEGAQVAAVTGNGGVLSTFSTMFLASGR